MQDEFTDYAGPAPALFKTRARGPLMLIETQRWPLRASYWPLMRDSGRRMAGMIISEPTGKVDRGRLRVSCGGDSQTVPATRDGVGAQVRRMRPQEFEQLEALNARIRALKLERRELKELAWRKAHVVTVKELVELAEAVQATADAIKGRGLSGAQA